MRIQPYYLPHAGHPKGAHSTVDSAHQMVNTTWVLDRHHGHAFYEVAKSASHRLVVSMADDLRPHGIAAIALSPGFMRGERMTLSPERAAMTESTAYVGRAVAALTSDPKVMEKSGKLLTVIEVAREYGFTDVDGRQISAFWEEYLSGSSACRDGGKQVAE